MKKDVEKELEELRAAARGFAAPALPQPTEPHHTQVTPLRPAQQQVTPPANRHTQPVEPAPPKYATRSSQLNAQSASNRVVSAKKRKTMESVSSSEAPLNLEDTEMVPESQGQVSTPTGGDITGTDSTLRQVTTTRKKRTDESELGCVNVDACSRVVAC
jgi:hypothetical protein